MLDRIMGSFRGVHPPKPMMHSPTSDFPVYFTKFVTISENFSEFPISQEKLLYLSAKISDGPFLVVCKFAYPYFHIIDTFSPIFLTKFISNIFFTFRLLSL